MKNPRWSGTGTGDMYIPAWKWFKSLDFLRDSISPVKTKPTLGVSLISIEESENVELKLSEAAAVDLEEDDESDTRKIQPQVNKQNNKYTKDLETGFLTSHLCCLRVQPIGSTC